MQTKGSAQNLAQIEHPLITATIIVVVVVAVAERSVKSERDGKEYK